MVTDVIHGGRYLNFHFFATARQTKLRQQVEHETTRNERIWVFSRSNLERQPVTIYLSHLIQNPTQQVIQPLPVFQLRIKPGKTRIVPENPYPPEFLGVLEGGERCHKVLNRRSLFQVSFERDTSELGARPEIKTEI